MARSAADSIPQPTLDIRHDAGGDTLRLGGGWTVLTVSAVEQELARHLAASPRLAAIDLAGVERLDTAGALLIRKASAQSGATIRTEDGFYRSLLEIAVPPAGKDGSKRSSGAVVEFLNAVGATIVSEYHLTKQLVGFLGEYIVEACTALKRPSSIPVTSLVYHMQQVGVAAVPIVALLAFLIGLVIAYMGVQSLALFGAQIFVVNLVEIVTLRELGVLLTSIVIAGRSGSSFTAQIGAMVANEEVAAMRSMGLSPMMRLAFPRITALILMLPALVFLADVMGLLGGGVAVWVTTGMSPSSYAARMQEIIQLGNLVTGLVKAPFFAVIIGVIGCFQGFQVTGSAESVGKLTTQSVVEGIFMVIVLDALFAIFFSALGV